jgi:hypothetical protein
VAVVRLALAALVVVLALPASAVAKDPPPVGTWAPDGVQCRIGATPTCRYVAPGCEMVRVMDPGTRYVLWCREPKGAE